MNYYYNYCYTEAAAYYLQGQALTNYYEANGLESVQTVTNYYETKALEANQSVTSYYETNCLQSRASVSESNFYDESGSLVPLPEELTNMFKPLECELCGVVVTSEVTAYTHYEGKVHIKNVNAYMKEQYNIYGCMRKEKPEFTPHNCEVCKCELSSLIQAQQHYSGKVHKKNLRKINYNPQFAVPLKTIASDDSGPDLLKDLPPPPPPPVLSDFICEICNITTNTEYQLIVHKNGSKHKKKVKKLKESFGDFGTDGFGYYKGENSITEDNTEPGSIPQPLITEYLPLSDKPLHFNNVNNNNNRYNTNLVTSNTVNTLNTINTSDTYNTNCECQAPDSDTDDSQPGALCIRWFNSKTEPLPPRPLENEWVKRFTKPTTDESNSSLLAKPCDIPTAVEVQPEAIHTQSSTLTDNPQAEAPSPVERTYELPPELENLPQFSIASTLTHLQAPPVSLVKNASDGSGETDAPETVENLTTSSSDPPKIHFRSPQHKPKTESETTDEIEKLDSKENEVRQLEKSTNETSIKTDPDSSLKREKSPTKIGLTSQAVGVGIKKNKGQFITTNWESSQGSSIGTDNNQSKKKLVNFLFGFKKELDKKKSGDTGTNNLKAGESEKEVVKLNNPSNATSVKIVPKKEASGVKEKTSTEEVDSSKENDSKEKPSDSRADSYKHSDKKIKEERTSKEKSHRNRKRDRYESDSYDRYRSKDSPRKHKKRKKYEDDYDRYDDYDRHRDRDDDYDRRRDRDDDYDRRRERDEDYDRHRDRDDDYDRHRHRERDDDYDRHRDRDDDYREEKKRHKHSSKEKSSHKSHSERKPTLAQPFIHKSSTRLGVLSYLAPPSDTDSKDVAMYRTPSGQYYCATCDYKSKHSSSFTDHLFSKEHKEKKLKKTK